MGAEAPSRPRPPARPPRHEPGIQGVL